MRSSRASLPPLPSQNTKKKKTVEFDMEPTSLYVNRRRSAAFYSEQITDLSLLESRLEQKRLSWAIMENHSIPSTTTGILSWGSTPETSLYPTETGTLKWARPNNSAMSSTTSLQGFHTPRPALAHRPNSWDHAGIARPHVRTLMRPQRLSSGPRGYNNDLKLKNKPGEAFQKLPKEVLDVILDELQKLHLEGNDIHQTCTTCWTRDLCNIALTSRNLAASARPKLYGHIRMIGADSTVQPKLRFRSRPAPRLKLLRKTLRSNPKLAEYVKYLKLPDIPDEIKTQKERDAYLDIVASIIMACPNLEKLHDFRLPYDYEFSRLTHALSTRTKLTEHIWNVFSSPGQDSFPISRSIRPLDQELPSHDGSSNFLSHHARWKELYTLVIHCSPSGSVEPSVMNDVIANLPKLTRLSISAVPCIPTTLLTQLPSLTYLHLANLPTLDSVDLCNFATSSSVASLISLTLINVSLTSLPVLARLISNLTSLERFTLQQDDSPTFPDGPEIVLHPYLASKKLRQLHWDILTPSNSDPTNPNSATNILATSIASNGFPSLRRLRAPCDYQGVLQNVCMPMDQTKLRKSTSRFLLPLKTQSERLSTARKDSGIAMGNSTSKLSEDNDTERDAETTSDLETDADTDVGYGPGYGYTRSLRVARLFAQERIVAASSKPRFQILCEDWTNPDAVRVTGKYEFAGFVGRAGVDSRVEYWLWPEPNAGTDSDVDAAGGLIGVEDLLESGEEKGGIWTKCCTGKWNKARKGWEHRERGRWRDGRLERVF